MRRKLKHPKTPNQNLHDRDVEQPFDQSAGVLCKLIRPANWTRIAVNYAVRPRFYFGEQMARIPRTITIKLPTYQSDRKQWRRLIHERAIEAAKSSGTEFKLDECFEVVVLLYLAKGKQHDHLDLDNLIKDVFDSLQAFFYNKGKDGLVQIIPNDSQICRLLVEKQPTPKRFRPGAADAGGKLLIRPYKRCGWPLQVVKGNRFIKRT